MSEKRDIWIDAYPDKEHCSHCHDVGYKDGFFDAGVTGLMIIFALLLIYGIEVMK